MQGTLYKNAGIARVRKGLSGTHYTDRRLPPGLEDIAYSAPHGEFTIQFALTSLDLPMLVVLG